MTLWEGLKVNYLIKSKLWWPVILLLIKFWVLLNIIHFIGNIFVESIKNSEYIKIKLIIFV